MSEPVTALNGAIYDFGLATVTELPLQGMITLRGDSASEEIRKVLKRILSCDIPEPGQIRFAAEMGLAWMSPDELLVLAPYKEVPDVLAQMTKGLANVHALAVNVSDARASFRLEGEHAREVLAKLCPVDLAPDVFVGGMFRRTRMAQVPAAFWLCGDEAFQIVCFRSQALYVFDLLCVAAQPGSEVGMV
jgi:sarcosine oxidase subunit gamma